MSARVHHRFPQAPLAPLPLSDLKTVVDKSTASLEEEGLGDELKQNWARFQKNVRQTSPRCALIGIESIYKGPKLGAELSRASH